ncbi:MAG: cytochrome b N-terminal domain-containing protein [Acidobacteria bacterium]|nr:cytochrome b N-terminal domain-containing protein [Acidobacteriota bacterium]
MTLKPALDWIDQRTGLKTAVDEFLNEEIPASSGWRHVFGSMAAFSFMLQAFTGVLLALNYAPTPGEAYNSVRYIMTELTGGSLIRGLHHYGASMMIIIVVLHMIQVFVWGAYKKPREATWIAGCTLLLITLAFGLTGYLLPWDNRAYWGTVVTTQIAGSAPVAGAYVQRLMGAESGVGVVTFARFFAAHVLVLPLLTMLLIGAHIYLVRKHGVAPEPGETAPRKKFFPEQVMKDTVAIFAAFAILFTLAVVAKAPLERIADPTDAKYIPRPEWYFLFLFQTLKLFEGPLEIVGSLVLPNLAIVALFLVPFIDRSAMAKLRQRTLAIGIVVLGAIGWAGLTTAAVMTTPKNLDQTADLDTAPGSWQQLAPEELAGIGYYRLENCASCHTPGPNAVGPDLAAGVRKDAAWMIDHFKRPAQIVPGTAMPAIALKDSQLNALAAFILKLNPKNQEALTSAPQFAVDGALVYQQNRCGACHQVNGAGMKMGPGLNGLATRRSRAWIEEHFANPQKMSPGTVMPPYKLAPKDGEALIKYLMNLPNPE